MKKYEYKTELVSRHYHGRDQEMECPETDILKKAGDEGWLLCAKGTPDSVGVCIFYFVRELLKGE